MASFKTIFSRSLQTWGPKATCLLLIAFFGWLVWGFYLPGKGFSALLKLGDKMSPGYLSELRVMDVYVEMDSYGYDAQFYAQMAMRPDVGEPQLASALDNVSYRARRILLSVVAWALAGGDPERALHIFAFQNVVFWLLLAWLLLRWFPADGWENVFRWAAVLFAYGTWFSVQAALADGPSLLLIAAGVALAEAGALWAAAAVLGLSGLAKETNVLAGGVLCPRLRWENGADFWRQAGRAALLVLPLLVWCTWLWLWFGSSGGAGERNFSGPLMGFGHKWSETLASLCVDPANVATYGSLCWLIAVTVQFLFLLLRPRWQELWWRVGAAFAVLMLFLGDAVWEGDPGAACRVLLPMTLAFNVLLPRGRRWWLLLLLGNLSVVSLVHTIRWPAHISYEIRLDRTAPSLSTSLATPAWQVMFDEGWYAPERSRWEYWRWSSGQAGITLKNNSPASANVRLSFGLRSKAPMQVTILRGETILWSGQVNDVRRDVVLSDVRLDPGEQCLRFTADRPAQLSAPSEIRPVAFSIRDLVIELSAAP